jgi:hypothetical protein
MGPRMGHTERNSVRASGRPRDRFWPIRRRPARVRRSKRAVRRLTGACPRSGSTRPNRRAGKCEADRDVETFVLALQRDAGAPGQLRVDVADAGPLVLEQLDWAVADVAGRCAVLEQPAERSRRLPKDRRRAEVLAPFSVKWDCRNRELAGYTIRSPDLHPVMRRSPVSYRDRQGQSLRRDRYALVSGREDRGPHVWWDLSDISELHAEDGGGRVVVEHEHPVSVGKEHWRRKVCSELASERRRADALGATIGQKHGPGSAAIEGVPADALTQSHSTLKVL